MLGLIAEPLALVATALFAGAAVYISLVEHPARESCGPAIAVAQFGPSYRRGAIMQGGLALVGFVAGLGRWATLGGDGWLAGGLLLGVLIPYTLIVIMPTNRALLASQSAPGASDVRVLLVRWGWLHAVRSLLSVVALVLFVALPRWHG